MPTLSPHLADLPPPEERLAEAAADCFDWKTWQGYLAGQWPEQIGDLPLPSTPTPFYPGTPGKVLAMIHRRAAGEHLYHPADAKGEQIANALKFAIAADFKGNGTSICAAKVVSLPIPEPAEPDAEHVAAIEIIDQADLARRRFLHQVLDKLAAAGDARRSPTAGTDVRTSPPSRRQPLTPAAAG